uniref:Uncharacterized protein n=1 Tax=Sphaerodactylus townsendi TaxID=933632 RepID=A0ACB8FLH7_9SAUR
MSLSEEAAETCASLRASVGGGGGRGSVRRRDSPQRAARSVRRGSRARLRRHPPSSVLPPPARLTRAPAAATRERAEEDPSDAIGETRVQTEEGGLKFPSPKPPLIRDPDPNRAAHLLQTNQSEHGSPRLHLNGRKAV